VLGFFLLLLEVFMLVGMKFEKETKKGGDRTGPDAAWGSRLAARYGIEPRSKESNKSKAYLTGEVIGSSFLCIAALGCGLIAWKRSGGIRGKGLVLMAICFEVVHLVVFVQTNV